MTKLDLSAAINAAAEAIQARRWIPDAGDGYPSIRVATSEQEAQLAVEAAAPLIERAVREQVARESDLIIYQAWDVDEIGWSDDNGMSGTDVEAVKLAALESFVEWSIEENWCGDPDEVDRFENELREGLHWRQVGKHWELHRGDTAQRGNATWQGINIFTMKVSRDSVGDAEAKCAKAKERRGRP